MQRESQRLLLHPSMPRQRKARVSLPSTHRSETDNWSSIICKYYPNDQCCQPDQPTPQQHPDLSSPVQNGVPVTNGVSPKDSWMQNSLENRWQYRRDNLNWDGGRVIKNPAVHDGQMSREPCPSWKQLFQLCWGVAEMIWRLQLPILCKNVELIGRITSYFS